MTFTIQRIILQARAQRISPGAQPYGPVLARKTEPVSPPGPHGLGHFYGGPGGPV